MLCYLPIPEGLCITVPAGSSLPSFPGVSSARAGAEGSDKTQHISLFNTGNTPYRKQTKAQTRAGSFPTQLELQICLLVVFVVFIF